MAERDRGGSYHHGDLRDALVAAAVAAARRGGTDAIVLRELTRSVGVTPRAAYRHFDGVQDLVEVVAEVAFRELAERIGVRTAAVDHPDPGTAAIATLQVIGEEYVAYARQDPGMFDVTFFARAEMADHDALRAADGRPTAYGMLTDTIRAIDAASLLRVPPPVAVLSCWSAVHGLATLAVRGPLRSMPDQRLGSITAGVVAAAIAGVVDPTAPGRRSGDRGEPGAGG